VAVLACICLDDTLGFNMLMCIFCVVAIVSLWSEDKILKKRLIRNCRAFITQQTILLTRYSEPFNTLLEKKNPS